MHSFTKVVPPVLDNVKGPTKLDPETKSILEQTASKILGVAVVANAKPKPHKTAKPIKKTKKVDRRVTFTVKKGNVYGKLTVIKKASPRKGVKSTMRERWLVQCACGSDPFIIPKYYLMRKGNPKTHCGCEFKSLKTHYKREFLIYHMMHQRCMNPNHASYNHYKRNGITIYEPWQKTNEDGFEKWFEEVGPAPSKYHSLDRIDNRKGYMPGNLRWATSEQQRANQGDTIAGYTLDEIDAMGLTEEEFIEKVQSGEIS